MTNQQLRKWSIVWMWIGGLGILLNAVNLVFLSPPSSIIPLIWISTALCGISLYFHNEKRIILNKKIEEEKKKNGK